MASIFKRPGLVALEIGWRVLAWLPFHVPIGIVLGSFGMDVHLGSPRAPVPLRLSEALLTDLFRNSWVFGVTPRFALTLLAALTFWAVVSAVGRIFILRKLQPELSANVFPVIVLSILRVWSFALLLGGWLGAFGVIYRRFVVEPTARGEYPPYVAGFALFTVLTLVLFMFWCVVSWMFPLATMLAMSQHRSLLRSLRAAWTGQALRSKFVEINMVMGIVKVCLLVLGMVFSASPLPFSNVTTKSFLNWWWFGCLVFWVLLSDYFHVVRAAAYLTLFRAYEPLATPAPSPDENPAS